jgi:hypothetical protein
LMFLARQLLEEEVIDIQQAAHYFIFVM